MSSLTLTLKKNVTKVIIESPQDAPILFMDPIELQIVQVKGSDVRLNIKANSKLKIRREKNEQA